MKTALKFLIESLLNVSLAACQARLSACVPRVNFPASTATNTSHGQIQIKTKTNGDENKNKTK